MKTINLIFGCHSHQPVGNFDFVFKMAYEQAYLPFVEVLERFPAVRVTQHITGPLLDWFVEHEPGFLERLAALVRAGQVEIMGGGYYEPLLCAIPERDSIAQIRRMNAFCEKHFGAAPKGMWLAERVWEPHMPRIMKEAGIEYTALDDSHFLCAGLAPDQMFGYYMTEEEGFTLKVFPILERLRYLIPFHQVVESIDYLREHATEDGLRCAVIHDDGEKFGLWPETNRSVYGEGWLEEFFQALTDNQDWIHSVTYSQYMEKAPAIGRCYFPTASYSELMEWALPTPLQRRLMRFGKWLKENYAEDEDRKQFVRGSFWRSFLAKYPESNNIQKKMLRISGQLDAIGSRQDACATNRKKTPAFKEAETLLHKGQCNCAYWHGVFGGLYLNHLRTALYEKLIAAEVLIDKMTHKNDEWVEVDVTDFDADGYDEAILENSNVWLGISPADGGTVFELDYKEKNFNFVNTLTRREEVYHDQLREGKVRVGEDGKGDLSIHELVRAKEYGLEKLLVYDPYRRVCLRDHFLPEFVTADELWAGTNPELGDFVTGAYALKAGKDAVTLTRDGTVWTDDHAYPVQIKKTLALKPRGSVVEIRYDLTNSASEPLNVMFGVEFAINLMAGNAFDHYYRSEDKDLQSAKLGETGCDEGLSHVALRDDWQHLECGLRFSRPARVYRFAIETVSQSENGQERVYQGSIVIPCWPLTCPPGKKVSMTLHAEVLAV